MKPDHINAIVTKISNIRSNQNGTTDGSCLKKYSMSLPSESGLLSRCIASCITVPEMPVKYPIKRARFAAPSIVGVAKNPKYIAVRKAPLIMRYRTHLNIFEFFTSYKDIMIQRFLTVLPKTRLETQLMDIRHTRCLESVRQGINRQRTCYYQILIRPV